MFAGSSNRSLGDIFLTPEETCKFIDSWAAHSCLWKQSHTKYKCNPTRRAALDSIAREFGRGWTRDQVKRKIESLRAQYRKGRNKRPQTGSSAVKKEKVWPYFQQIHAFLSGQEYNRSQVLGSMTQPTATQEDAQGSIHSNRPSSTGSNDMDQLVRETLETEPLDQRVEPAVLTLVSQDHLPSFASPPAKQGMLGRPPAPKLQDPTESALIPYMSEGNPHAIFGKWVASQLAEIKNRTRLIHLRLEINRIIAEALLEESQEN